MRVMKFGGGCLRAAEDFIRAGEILTDTAPGSTVVVVSAVFGVTDLLERAAYEALESEATVSHNVDRIEQLHTSMVETIGALLCGRFNIDEELHQIIAKLERLLYGIAYTGELSDSVRNLVLSQGERLSARILAASLRAQGMDSRAWDSDLIGVVTDWLYDNATALLEATHANVCQALLPYLEREHIPVVTGFFGCTREGKVTSFGRNGSDYSAAVIAAALGAEELLIWKDVDGFMTCDPRLIRRPSRIGHLSYREAAELSYFGAKILHPRTVEPLIPSGIPIHMMNIRHRENEGTLIQPSARACDEVIKSITYNSELSVLRIHGAGVGHKPGIVGEIGQALSDRNINIYSVITSQTCINLLLDARDGQQGESLLRPLVGGAVERLELRTDLALIAVVGEGILITRGLAARVFTAVADAGINVEMFAAGASEVAYYFIVNRAHLESAVIAVHQEFFGDG